MNFASTKQRILQFIENEQLTVAKFLAKTGIKRGFLDSDKLQGSVSDDHLAKIIAAFPHANLHWLITGSRASFAQSDQSIPIAEENAADYLTENRRLQLELLEAKNEIIDLQRKLLAKPGKRNAS